MKTPVSSQVRPVDKWFLTNHIHVITVLKPIQDIVVASPVDHNILWLETENRLDSDPRLHEQRAVITSALRRHYL
ncbi:MAG: hypothetical protein DWQ40_04005 [Actinobacteria bacterium]|nr:MAG: hypothetical protein DWQ40_04005 [Actinomycetota bacterium]